MPFAFLQWAVQLFHYCHPDYPDYPHHFIVASTPDAQVGYSDELVTVNRVEVEVSEEMATTLYQVWRTMLGRISPVSSYAIEEERAYHFSCDCRRLSGQAWSPMRNTPAGRLISLSKSLYSYALAPDPKRSELASNILVETDWFKTLP